MVTAPRRAARASEDPLRHEETFFGSKTPLVALRSAQGHPTEGGMRNLWRSGTEKIAITSLAIFAVILEHGKRKTAGVSGRSSGEGPYLFDMWQPEATGQGSLLFCGPLVSSGMHRLHGSTAGDQEVRHHDPSVSRHPAQAGRRMRRLRGERQRAAIRVRSECGSRSPDRFGPWVVVHHLQPSLGVLAGRPVVVQEGR